MHCTAIINLNNEMHWIVSCSLLGVTFQVLKSVKSLLRMLVAGTWYCGCCGINWYSLVAMATVLVALRIRDDEYEQFQCKNSKFLHYTFLMIINNFISHVPTISRDVLCCLCFWTYVHVIIPNYICGSIILCASYVGSAARWTPLIHASYVGLRLCS